MQSNFYNSNQSSRGGFTSSSRPSGASSRGRGRREVAPCEFGTSDFKALSQRNNNILHDRQKQSHQEPTESIYTSTGRDHPGYNRLAASRQSPAAFQAREIPPYETPTNGEFDSFAEVIDQTTINQLTAHNITSLFPIQRDCFYPIYHGANVIGRELTGCGKTLAFALPLVEQLRKAGNLGSGMTQAIVLAPTRELAIQVEKTFTMLKHQRDEFETLTVYGGVAFEEQTRKLRQGVDIFVGTTGRVLDHIRRGNINFAHLKSIVLDEADMMLDMGFKEDIDEVLRHVSLATSQQRNELQICLFSATVPDWVTKVAYEYMKGDFKMVDLAQDLQNKTAKNVRHLAIHVQSPRDQLKALNAVLTAATGGASYLPKSIVFTQTKVEADRLCKVGGGMQGGIGVMHGDISQAMRERTIEAFKKNVLRVLIATDVASRGLDIPNVDLIVQFNPPKNTETYIHRSGRTARAGASGTCVTFYNQSQQYMIHQIVQQSGINMEQVDDLSALSITPNNTYEQSAPDVRSKAHSQPKPNGNAKVNARPSRKQSQMKCADQSATQLPQASVPDAVLTKYNIQARKLMDQHQGSSRHVICHLLSFIESQGLSFDDFTLNSSSQSDQRVNESDETDKKTRQRVRHRGKKSSTEDVDKENQSQNDSKVIVPETCSDLCSEKMPAQAEEDQKKLNQQVAKIDPEHEEFFDCLESEKTQVEEKTCEQVSDFPTFKREDVAVIEIDDTKRCEPLQDYLDEEELEDLQKHSEFLQID